MTVGSCVAFLGCSSEVTLVVTQLAFSLVNHVLCLAVQRPWDIDVGVVNRCSLFTRGHGDIQATSISLYEDL